MKVELAYDPPILFLGMYPQRIESRDSNWYLYPRVHNSITRNSPGRKAREPAPQVSGEAKGVQPAFSREGSDRRCPGRSSQTLFHVK